MPASNTLAVEPSARHTVLELIVNNHPGVMSHICGLFARRAFNVEGILCMPIGDRTHSRIWLLVNDDDRLEQMVKQLQKLVDVNSVQQCQNDAKVRLRKLLDEDTPRYPLE